jgi:hypothetical protein
MKSRKLAAQIFPALMGMFKRRPNLYCVAKSAAYTAADDAVILVTTGAADKTITLPAVANATDRAYYIKKVDAGAGKVDVDPDGAETIDGAGKYTLDAQYDSVLIVCDGSSWHILAGWP